MAGDKSDIYGQARALARNPLGLVALFILLVYALATTVLGLKADVLQPDERKILLYFLVIFPCLVLIVFYLLVSRHHGKLYAPYDYKTDDMFLKTLEPERQRERLEDEIREDAAISRAAENAATPPSNRVPEGGVESTTGHVTQYSRAKYLLAEELAIRALEAELGRAAQRQVAVVAYGRSREYDAVFPAPPETIAVEVKLVTSKRVIPDVISNTIAKAAFLKNLPGPTPRLILAVITDGHAEAQRMIGDQLSQAVSGSDVPNIEVRGFELSELQRRFGAESAG